MGPYIGPYMGPYFGPYFGSFFPFVGCLIFPLWAAKGVSKDSSEDDTKKAYRKLALRLHPDKCQESGAEEAPLCITLTLYLVW